MVHYWRGDFARAATTLETACRALRRHGDRVAEARTRVTLGAVLGQVHDYRSAERHLTEAISVAEDIGQLLLVAASHHNLGYLAMLQRDLPRAIGEFELAESGLRRRSAPTGTCHGSTPTTPRSSPTPPCSTTPTRSSSRALDMLAKDGNEIEMAGALVTAAEIRLAQRDHAGARAAADEAAGWYRKQGRDGWVAISTSLALQAAARDESPPPDVADQLDEVAERLDGDGLGAEAIRSRLVAALVRIESSATMTDDPVPAETRRRIRRGSAADRILLAHVDAVAARTARRPAGGAARDQPWVGRGDVEPSRPRVDRDACPRRRPRQRPHGDRSAHRHLRSVDRVNCWPGSKRRG